MAALRAIVGLVPVAPEGGNPVGREPEGGNPVGRDLVGREPVGREAVRNGPVFPARAALATGSAALRGQAAPVTAAIAADRVAAVGAVLPALVPHRGSGAGRSSSTAAGSYRDAGSSTSFAARKDVDSGGSRHRGAGPKLDRSAVPSRKPRAFKSSSQRDGGHSPSKGGWDRPAPRRDGPVVSRRDGPGSAARTKLKTSPIPDPFRARSAAQPRPVTTSGQERLGHRVRSRPVVLGWTQVAGAGDSRGLRALRVRPPVVGRPQSAATNGRGRPGEAPVARASLSVAVDVRPSPRAGVVLQTPDVSSGATRSRAARPSGNCLPRT